ncbi:MAG: leucine-rich repeat domain-containing protein [Clostridiales bacterium]|nr:leucine-rich repeat domain-containing protein [Clostridiales bacterium]
MKDLFAAQTKRALAALLVLSVLFSTVACKNRKEQVQSDEPSIETTAATTSSSEETSETTSESTSEETTTETTKPEPTGVTGTYLMMYENHQADDMPIGVRLELMLEDDKIAVMFERVYPNLSSEGIYVSFSYDPIGPYVVEAKENGGVYTAECGGEIHSFTVASDGKSADVSHSVFGQKDDQDSITMSGHYERIDHEDYTPAHVPSPTNDPATPGGAVDSVLAKLAREQLGLSKDAVLTEDDLSKVYALDLDSEYDLSLNGIEYFTNLRTIKILFSYIQDISPLANLHSLQEICICTAPVDTIPDLSQCRDLKALTLSECNIRDISPVASLESLTTLELSGNDITSIAPIKDMDSLRTLSLGDNPITDWETIADNEKLRAALSQDFDKTMKVIDKARAIVNETITGDMSDLEKEIAIYKKVQEIAEPELRDPDGVYQEANPFGYMVLIEGWGLCGDYSEAVALLMTLAGLECFQIHSSTHMWNVIKIDGVYYEIDCMWDDRNEVEGLEYLNLSRARMDEYASHHVEIPRYPVADCSMLRLEYLRMLNIVSQY